MTVTFNATLNAFELFEIAEAIETNGARFYRRAAQTADDSEISEVFLQLAAMEENHRRIFAGIQKELLENERRLLAFDPITEIAQYLQSLVEGKVFGDEKYNSGRLAGLHDIKDVLTMALDAEKDSIVFYLGLKELVSPKAGRDRIEAIIKEEMGHISVLNRRLTALK